MKMAATDCHDPCDEAGACHGRDASGASGASGGQSGCDARSYTLHHTDGALDIGVTSGLNTADAGDNNAIFMNAGDGEFRRVANTSFVTDKSMSYGLELVDIDSDGDVDILVRFPSRYVLPIAKYRWDEPPLILRLQVANLRQQNALYYNEGGVFRQVITTSPGMTTFANDRPGKSVALQVVDIDGDSDLDVLALNYGEQNAIYKFHDCPDGSARLQGGRSWCFDCPAFTTQTKRGEDRCDLCPAGKQGVAGKSGLVEASMCVPCDAGRYRSRLASTCELCGAGQYSGGGGAPCSDCAAPAIVTGQTINGIEYPASTCQYFGTNEVVGSMATAIALVSSSNLIPKVTMRVEANAAVLVNGSPEKVTFMSDLATELATALGVDVSNIEVSAETTATGATVRRQLQTTALDVAIQVEEAHRAEGLDEL